MRITSGLNTIVANGVLGNPNDDIVVMDDFIYAQPNLVVGIPEPGTYALMGAGLLALAWMKLRRGAAPSEAAH